MTKTAEKHLAAAKDYVAKGEQFYRKAAAEMVAAKNEGATWVEIGDGVDRSDEWCKVVVAWAKTPANSNKSTLPFSEPQGAVAQRHARSVLRQADAEALSEVMASLSPERIAVVAQTAHEAHLKSIRHLAVGRDTLTDADYGKARGRMEDVRANSTIEMQELFTALSRLRVRGVEDVIAKAGSAERRQWATRLPDEIALLQLALDLCKTTKLEAVR